MRRAGVLAGVALLCAVSAGRAGQAGSLEGRVGDALTGHALRGARVSVVGRRSETRTNDSGFYLLPKLPAGPIVLRINLSGYAAAVEQVEIAGATRANVNLVAASTLLDAMLVLGNPPDPPAFDSGGTRTMVRTDDRSTGAASSNDLVSQIPGARVIRISGQIGAGTAVQLRGVKSLLTNSDPVIYLDGVRVSSQGSRLTNRMNGPTVLDLIDPATIDRIEVLPGSAAAMLYGDGASNGVILIYTKQGGG